VSFSGLSSFKPLKEAMYQALPKARRSFQTYNKLTRSPLRDVF